MTVLPSNWVVARLDEVAEVVQGQSPPGSSYNTDALGTPFFQGKAEFGDVYPTVAKWTTAPKKRAKKGDVLLSVRAPVGPTNLAPLDCAIGRGLAALHPLAGIDTKYLLYALRTSAGQLAAESTGTTFPAVSGVQVKAHRIPVAPSAEQRRIVDAIEEQFSRLDAAEESLRRAHWNLGRHRLAALLSEMEGKWERRPLGELLVSLKNGLFISRPAAEPPGTPIFRISAVRPMWLNVEDVRYAPVDETYAAGYFVEEGDLLITRYSGNPSFVGTCARVPHLERPTLHPDKLIKAVVNTSVVDSAYLEIALSVGEAHGEIRKRRKTTAGQVGISGGQLKTVLVPTPTLDIQREVVANVGRQASVSEALDRDLTTSLQRVKSLRGAVLREAFAGRLVTQDSSDELVSAFLEAVKT